MRVIRSRWIALIIGRSSARPRLFEVARLVGVVAALLFASATAVHAATPVHATASIDRDSMTIGDPLMFTLVVNTETGYRVVDPGVIGGIGPFELRESFRPELEELPGGSTRHTFRYRITTFTLGDHKIPPIDVSYQDHNGGRGIARTEELIVQVRSVIRDGEDARDIKPLKPQLELADPLAQVGAALRALSYALVALTAVAVVLGRTRVSDQRSAAPRTPAERALRELRRIGELRLPEKRRSLEHYELVSSCIRRYAREQFGLAANARTPRELRVEMSRANVAADQARMIDEVLVESERIRFGRAPVSVEDAQAALHRASAVLTEASAGTADA